MKRTRKSAGFAARTGVRPGTQRMGFQRGARKPWVKPFEGRRADAGAELKFLDTAKAATTTSATGTIFDASLNIVPQNNEESGRIGRKIVVKAIHLQGIFKVPTTAVAADTSDTARVIVYQDKQTNGAAATVALILESATLLSWNNLSEKGRFTVLMDRKMSLSSGSGSGQQAADIFGEVQEHFEWHKPVNIPIEYDATAATGAIGTQRSNNIGVLVISGEARSSISYNARIRYTDG